MCDKNATSPCCDSCCGTCQNDSPDFALEAESIPAKEVPSDLAALMEIAGPGRVLSVEAQDFLIKTGLEALQARVYGNAVVKGWWELPEAAQKVIAVLQEQRDVELDGENFQQVAEIDKAIAAVESLAKRNFGEAIALIHSEASEALESARKGSVPDDKVPQFSGEEAELADVVIRILDLAGGLKLRVIDAMLAKHAYNTTRPYKHGKKF